MTVHSIRSVPFTKLKSFVHCHRYRVTLADPPTSPARATPRHRPRSPMQRSAQSPTRRPSSGTRPWRREPRAGGRPCSRPRQANPECPADASSQCLHGCLLPFNQLRATSAALYEQVLYATECRLGRAGCPLVASPSARRVRHACRRAPVLRPAKHDDRKNTTTVKSPRGVKCTVTESPVTESPLSPNRICINWK